MRDLLLHVGRQHAAVSIAAASSAIGREPTADAMQPGPDVAVRAQRRAQSSAADKQR